MTTAPPHKGENPGVCGAEVLRSNEISGSIVQHDSCADKLVAKAKAEYALRGWGLYELADGTFLASGFAGWPPKPMPDLQSAMRFLRNARGVA